MVLTVLFVEKGNAGIFLESNVGWTNEKPINDKEGVPVFRNYPAAFGTFSEKHEKSLHLQQGSMTIKTNGACTESRNRYPCTD
jgi:hypothetical protein